MLLAAVWKWSLFISDPRETDSDSVLSVMSEISLLVAWGTVSWPHACTSGMKRARVHMHALTMMRYQRSLIRATQKSIKAYTLDINHLITAAFSCSRFGGTAPFMSSTTDIITAAGRQQRLMMTAVETTATHALVSQQCSINTVTPKAT